jgi:MarR family transcriptional regulator for hemolysin
VATDVQAPPQSAPKCLLSNLGWMLDQAHHAFGSEVAVALAPLGLGQRGFCVLQTAMDAELTQTQLASAIGLDKTTMVVTIDELERRGFAERVQSAADRRARVIKVTDAGRAMVAKGRRITEDAQAEVLATLAPDEREAFVGGLMRLVSGRLSSAPECHPPLRRREQRA